MGHEARLSDERQTLTLLARPGALERIFATLRRRLPTMLSMSAAESEDAAYMRVTFRLRCTLAEAERVAPHLAKLVDVRAVAVATPSEAGANAALSREFALARVRYDAQTRREILDIAQLFGARVVAVAPETLTLEISASATTVDNALRMLEPLGVVALSRSGAALPAGAPAGAPDAEADAPALRATG